MGKGLRMVYSGYGEAGDAVDHLRHGCRDAATNLPRSWKFLFDREPGQTSLKGRQNFKCEHAFAPSS